MKIWFKRNIKDIQLLKSRKNISYHKITKNNYESYILEITQCVELFNTEINWGDMWDLNDLHKRFNDNHILYIMMDKNVSLGYVWYNENYLYNTFVSKTRTKGDSQNFINYTLNELKIDYDKITLYCDDWNIGAQKFFKGIGFINFNK